MGMGLTRVGLGDMQGHTWEMIEHSEICFGPCGDW